MEDLLIRAGMLSLLARLRAEREAETLSESADERRLALLTGVSGTRARGLRALTAADGDVGAVEELTRKSLVCCSSSEYMSDLRFELRASDVATLDAATSIPAEVREREMRVGGARSTRAGPALPPLLRLRGMLEVVEDARV